jgi:DNA-binding transcriptional MerR regulator
VARRAGVHVETLRYYQRRGLLPEPVRIPGGHRRYDEETVRFLCAVKEAQAAGFTLAEIEDYLKVVRRGRIPAPQALRVRAAVKIGQIDARIARLRRMRDELARIAGCACESLDHCTCGAAWLARQGRDSPARPWLLHGDTWFYRALAALGRGPGRLVQTRGGDQLPPAPLLGDAHAFTTLPSGSPARASRCSSSRQTAYGYSASTAG